MVKEKLNLEPLMLKTIIKGNGKMEFTMELVHFFGKTGSIIQESIEMVGSMVKVGLSL